MDESFFQARDALLEAGEHELAAEAEVLIGRTAWEQGDQDLAFAHLRRAHELVRDAPVSHSKALVLHWLSRSLALADQIDEAIVLGRETIAMAEVLGLDELRANALTTMGFTRFTTGDLGGLADAEESIEIARAANSPDVVRSLGNYASCLKDLGEIARAAEIIEEARAGAVRFGRGIYSSWLDGEGLIYRYYDGRWDDALELADQMTEEFETSGSSSFMEAGVRAYRALMLLARDDPETALEETARSLELAHRAKDAQVLHPSLGTYAVVRSRLGLLDEATQAADELLEDWSQGTMLGTAEWLLDLAYVLVPLGRLDDLEQALGRVKLDFPWLRARPGHTRPAIPPPPPRCLARSATGRTRPTCVSYRESTQRCARRSTSTARSARPGTCARAKRRWRRPHERDARRAQGRHRPLLRPGRVHLFF